MGKLKKLINYFLSGSTKKRKGENKK